MQLLSCIWKSEFFKLNKPVKLTKYLSNSTEPPIVQFRGLELYYCLGHTLYTSIHYILLFDPIRIFINYDWKHLIVCAHERINYLF